MGIAQEELRICPIEGLCKENDESKVPVSCNMIVTHAIVEHYLAPCCRGINIHEVIHICYQYRYFQDLPSSMLKVVFSYYHYI